jgi:hypothetical protein
MSKLSVRDWAPFAVLTTSWMSPDLIASTQCGRPSSTLLMVRTGIPASLMRRAVPLVATRLKPMSISRRATPTVVVLSESRTLRKAVPASGSFTPAPSWALAKARSKLTSRPITSPVDFISGPRMVSTLGKRANGKTASLTATCRAMASSSRLNSLSWAPAITRAPILAMGMPVALATNGTVRLARGFTSKT